MIGILYHRHQKWIQHPLQRRDAVGKRHIDPPQPQTEIYVVQQPVLFPSRGISPFKEYFEETFGCRRHHGGGRMFSVPATFVVAARYDDIAVSIGTKQFDGVAYAA